MQISKISEDSIMQEVFTYVTLQTVVGLCYAYPVENDDYLSYRLHRINKKIAECSSILFAL